MWTAELSKWLSEFAGASDAVSPRSAAETPSSFASAFLPPLRSRRKQAQGPASNGIRIVREALRTRVALVQAPAGWGKTTAVRAALALQPYRWVDVATAPDEPYRVVFGLAAALELAGSDVARVLAGDDPAGIRAWLAANLPSDGVIVVDDVHLADPDSIGLLSMLVEGSSNARWVLISRRPTALPTGSWMAKGIASMPVGQDDLAIDAATLLALADRLHVPMEDRNAQRIVEAVRGWPVAVHFVLLALQRTDDFARIATLVRESLFSYLAHDVFAHVPFEKKSLLTDLALLGRFDAETLAAHGCAHAAADLDWILCSGIPLHQADGGYLLHDSVAEYLLCSDASHDRARIERVKRVVGTLMRLERLGEVFDLVRKHLPERILDVLRSYGFNLMDVGRWRSIDAAIRALPYNVRRNDPVILGLRAAIELGSGAIDRAEEFLIRGLSLAADDRLRARLSRMLAIQYCNQNRCEAVRIVRSVTDLGYAVDRIESRGVLAEALAIAGDYPGACAVIDEAVTMAKELDDDPLLAITTMRSAAVRRIARMFDESETLAQSAACLAERIGSWWVYGHAHDVLSAISSQHRNDRSMAAYHLQEALLGAERCGDRHLTMHLLGAKYEIEVESGNHVVADLVERSLQAQVGYSSDAFGICLVMAIRRGWDRDFKESLRRLDTLNDRISDPSERRCHEAAKAMFAAFSEEIERADEALHAVGRRSKSRSPSSDILDSLADCFAAFAEVHLGRPAAAARRSLPRSRHTQMRALTAAVRVLALGGDSSEAVELLLREGQAGYARLMAAAFAPKDTPPASLTDAEWRVLREMNGGRSPKQIAQGFGKSIETIRSQVKAIYRKLETTSAAETLAVARRRGFL